MFEFVLRNVFDRQIIINMDKRWNFSVIVTLRKIIAFRGCHLNSLLNISLSDFYLCFLKIFCQNRDSQKSFQWPPTRIFADSRQLRSPCAIFRMNLFSGSQTLATSFIRYIIKLPLIHHPDWYPKFFWYQFSQGLPAENKQKKVTSLIITTSSFHLIYLTKNVNHFIR